jgi:hypothetical protein
MTTYVGFVSLGNRGLPMAQHLRKASYALHVLTRTAADDAKSRETDAKQGEGSWLRERPATPSHRHAAHALDRIAPQTLHGADDTHVPPYLSWDHSPWPGVSPCATRLDPCIASRSSALAQMDQSSVHRLRGVSLYFSSARPLNDLSASIAETPYVFRSKVAAVPGGVGESDFVPLILRI